METPKHVFQTLAQIQQSNPQLLQKQWNTISRLVWEIHFWFDEFCGQPPYGNVYTLFYHREVRHHWEGIDQSVAIFTKKFGSQYADLIRTAAQDHVMTDFTEIPSQSECTRRYLREKRGW